jgi:ectoine hydroxylase-related dioxygenase (phytanoyl-CoA dioxygenase family)
VPFEAMAGSVIVLDGRLWHTSGKNVTKTERRALLFAYYTRGFVRAQVNWDVCLSETAKARLDDDARTLLGMGPYSNVAQALDLVMLR